MIKAGFILRIIALLFIFFIFSPRPVEAAPKPSCNDANPGSVPLITGITTQNATVTLTWVPALDPVTHYTLAYGLEKEQLVYGAPHIGSKESTSFTVDQLTIGQRYYFRIRAVNNCEPGDFSDTVSVVVGINKDEKKLEIPRLSFFKPDTTVTPSTKDDGKWKKGMNVLGVKTSALCSDCMSIPLLIGEIGVLLLYFFLAHKISFIKPIFSVIIPIAFYMVFLFLNKNCSSYFFFCEYFGVLSLISFVLILLVQKQLFIHKLMAPHLVEETKENKK